MMLTVLMFQIGNANGIWNNTNKADIKNEGLNVKLAVPHYLCLNEIDK